MEMEKKRNEEGSRGETRNWKLRSRKERQVKNEEKGMEKEGEERKQRGEGADGLNLSPDRSCLPLQD